MLEQNSQDTLVFTVLAIRRYFLWESVPPSGRYFFYDIGNHVVVFIRLYRQKLSHLWTGIHLPPSTDADPTIQNTQKGHFWQICSKQATAHLCDCGSFHIFLGVLAWIRVSVTKFTGCHMLVRCVYAVSGWSLRSFLQTHSPLAKNRFAPHNPTAKVGFRRIILAVETMSLTSPYSLLAPALEAWDFWTLVWTGPTWVIRLVLCISCLGGHKLSPFLAL